MPRLSLLAFVALTLTACPSEPADDVTSHEENLALLPGLELLIDFPSLDDGARAVGDESMLLVHTSEAADDVDDTLEPSLSIIATIEVLPPQETSENLAHWSQPGAGSASAEVNVWVEDEGAGLIDYLVMREAGGDATLSVWGEVQDLGDGSTEGTLAVRDEPIPMPTISTLPLDGLQDPNEGASVEAQYGLTPDGAEILAWWEPDESLWSIEGCRYMEAATSGGGGTIDVVESIDIAGGPDPELLAVRVQWADDGSGRADAVVCDEPCEDIEADRLGTFTECFDSEGVVTYVNRTWVPAEDGDAASCPFTEEVAAQAVVDTMVAGCTPGSSAGG